MNSPTQCLTLECCCGQGSPDHRGTPDKPGRVVTLIPVHRCYELEQALGQVYCTNGEQEHEQEQERTWGVAFRIAEENRKAVLEKLDYREKAGFDKLQLHVWCDFEDSGTSMMIPRVVVASALVYVAQEGNDDYLGPADLETTAAHIAACEGPSGRNVDYLFTLAAAMMDLGVTTDKYEFCLVMNRDFQWLWPRYRAVHLQYAHNSLTWC